MTQTSLLPASGADPSAWRSTEARHAEVWPEMRAALAATGWRNYSLFVTEPGSVIGYLECDDFEAARGGDGGDRGERALAARDGRVLRRPARGSGPTKGSCASTRSSTLTERPHRTAARRPDPPLLVLEHAEKSFGAVHALGTARSSCAAARRTRWSARTAPASRPWSRSSPASTDPTRGRLLLDGEDVIFDSAGASRRPPGSRSSTRSRRCSPTSRVAENIFIGRQPLRPRPADRPAAHAPRGRGALRAARRAPRPGPPGPRPVDRRPADRRDRQGAVVRRPGDRDGRADRGADRDRGRPAVRGGRTLRADGAAVLFISHRLEEVFALCQRVTVMRDGAYVLDPARSAEMTIDSPSSASMVGRDLDALFPKVEAHRARSCWRSSG